MEECGPPLSTEESPRGPRKKGGVKGGGESSGKDEAGMEEAAMLDNERSRKARGRQRGRHNDWPFLGKV
jgi:hypothetical protein